MISTGITLNKLLGSIASCLLLGMTLLTAALVVARYLFDTGSIALQELTVIFHGSIFLLGLSYTLSADEHVRVDIFYQRMSPLQKDWVNAVFCLLFLLPFTAFLTWLGILFFHTSFTIRESSPEPGGLPYLFLFKAILPLGTFCLFLQGLSLFFSSARRVIAGETA